MLPKLRVAFIASIAMTMFAQDGQLVSVDPGVGTVPKSIFFFYNGAITTPEYICIARDSVSTVSQTIASATAANPGVFTKTAHGMFVSGSNFRPKITISGGTGNWAAANGTWVATALDADTFTIASMSTGTSLDTSTFGAVTGTLTFSTNAPLQTSPVWLIRKFSFDGSNRVINVAEAYTSSGYSANICANRASATFEWK